MRQFIVSVAAALVGLLSPASLTAQEADADPAPRAASRDRLDKALARTAAMQNTAFEAKWGPAGKAKKADPFQAMLSAQASGKANGSWHPKVRTCAFGGKEGDEFITTGRRTIAKSENHDWRIRAGRFADGNAVKFAPDIELLLELLDGWQLAVTHSEVGSLDDRPVEIVSITLNEDQVAEAVWSGALPQSLVAGGFGGNVFRFAMGIGAGGGGGRQAAKKPQATVDLAITIDPAAAIVHQVHCRAYLDSEQGGMAGRVVVVGGAAGFAGEEEDEEEEEEEEEADEGAPLTYEKGLPKRPRKKKSVNDFVVTLRDHGRTKAPELTPEQKKLLKL